MPWPPHFSPGSGGVGPCTLLAPPIYHRRAAPHRLKSAENGLKMAVKRSSRGAPARCAVRPPPRIAVCGHPQAQSALQGLGTFFHSLRSLFRKDACAGRRQNVH